MPGSGRRPRQIRTEKSYSRLPSTAIQTPSAWAELNPETAASVVRVITNASNALCDAPEFSLNAFATLCSGLDATDRRSIYEGEWGGIRSAVTREDFDFAQNLFVSMNAILRTFTDEETTAMQLASLWTLFCQDLRMSVPLEIISSDTREVRERVCSRSTSAVSASASAQPCEMRGRPHGLGTGRRDVPGRHWHRPGQSYQ
ncbi:hypothetical protein [Roseicella aerolata]|uniref:Uncharacterized protein n=1 Tax=Roseicella aerolata TaxID=2883479 RepID=A0A9X1IKR7_9PROT|nr:hypothetical protein [Roseicella aerolata]MCB4825423.1 hypothetical protein [Roseicella aerolata]